MPRPGASKRSAAMDAQGWSPAITTHDLRPGRLHRQRLLRPHSTSPADVLRWFGAMQAQDSRGALWALGLRTRGATEADIARALDEGSVVRTHVFRWTWQYVVAGDLRWMLGLVGNRLLRGAAGRNRQLELDSSILRRAANVFSRALAGGKHLTRAELATALDRAKITSAGGRLSHLLGHAELSAIICSGAPRGKHLTFALLDERIPPTRAMDRDAALAQLA